MRPLSIRHKIATIEASKSGVGVSAGARKYMRTAMPEYKSVGNAELNELIVFEFSKCAPWSRFKLNKTLDGIAEIRKSSRFVFVARIRDRGTSQSGYDIITIQPNSKEVSEKIRKLRLQPGWGFE